MSVDRWLILITENDYRKVEKDSFGRPLCDKVDHIYDFGDPEDDLMYHEEDIRNLEGKYASVYIDKLFSLYTNSRQSLNDWKDIEKYITTNPNCLIFFINK